MKKVSIIIPVYNVEKYLKKCLDSLVNQTLEDIEIIIVNDGSPDNSQKIINQYVEKYPNLIKSYIQENGGQGSARNYGLSMATGEYIGYVDSDDFVELDMFEKLYNKAIERDFDIVICGNNLYSEDYKIIGIENINFSNNGNNIYNNPHILFDKMAVWNKLYKKELLENMIFRSKLWYEDFDFSFIVLTKAKNIGFVEKPLYNYLLRVGSTMNNKNALKNLNILEAFDKIISYSKEKNIFNKLNNEIEFLCIDHIYISTIVRVINTDINKKEKKKIISTLINYVNNNFPNYHKNKYIKQLSKNRKLIYILIKLKMYKLISLIFKIKKL